MTRTSCLSRGTTVGHHSIFRLLAHRLHPQNLLSQMRINAAIPLSSAVTIPANPVGGDARFSAPHGSVPVLTALGNRTSKCGCIPRNLADPCKVVESTYSYMVGIASLFHLAVLGRPVDRVFSPRPELKRGSGAPIQIYSARTGFQELLISKVGSVTYELHGTSIKSAGNKCAQHFPLSGALPIELCPGK